MHQHWGKLLFVHWRVPVDEVRKVVPPWLEIDTFDGEAWVGLTPFTMWGIRPSCFPALPWLSSSHELNVRTYVHHNGVPGIWFLSLDASNPLAVLGARSAFGLPYFRAKQTLAERSGTVSFQSIRTHRDAPRAELNIAWELGATLPPAEPGSLEYFLIERYCLYTNLAGCFYRGRIHHAPWPLRTARLLRITTTMLESHALRTPSAAPLVHAQAASLHVRVWPLETVS